MQLTSKIHVEKICKKGVTLGPNRRGLDIRLVSLSDFEIESPFGREQLLVRKSRENLNSNHFNVTVSVPPTVRTAFQGQLTLRSPASGAVAHVPINFDP